MSKEIELKFQIDQTQIDALRHFLNQWVASDDAQLRSQKQQTTCTAHPMMLSNIYYDTKDNDLRRNRCGLRVRIIERCNQTEYELTLKSDKKSLAGFSERNEYNVNLPDAMPNLSLLPICALPANIDVAQLQLDLIPLFSTNFKRQTWLVSFAQSEIEVALDQGCITANNNAVPILELELEIKQGNKQDLIQFAIELSRFKLHLFSQSKAARGYALLATMPLKTQSFDQQCTQNLSQLLAFWQQNEEVALETNDLIFYQKVLSSVEQTLSQMNVPCESEFSAWQVACKSVQSVKDFAYSQINTTLKLMLFLLC